MPEAEGYQKALELAWQRLHRYDVGSMASASGARSNESGMMIIRLLNEDVTVDIGSDTILAGSLERDIFLDVLLLHYLAGCAGHPRYLPQNNWQMFRQLPGGEAYHAAFQKRVIEGIARTFSDDPSKLVRAASRLNGRLEGVGTCVLLPFLPRLPVKVIVWPGDDEIPGSANLLFPVGSELILPTEDHAEVGTVVLGALKRALLSSDR